MQTPQNQVKILTELGLNFCEARVFLALANLGMGPAKMISKTSGVSKPDVYRALVTLQERGLVEKIISSPAIFKAIQLEESLSILLGKKDIEQNLLREKTEQLKRDFKYNLNKLTTQENEQQFILITRKDAELERRRKQQNNALKNIDAINSWKRFPKTQFFYAEEIKEALQRGVKIRLITEEAEDMSNISMNYRDLKKVGFYRIRFVSVPLSSVVSIYDGKEVIISTSPGASFGEAGILWSNNASIVKVMQEYFEMLWAKAKRYSAHRGIK
ncbi:MAG: helix-turn-helix domain-containing protein [Candidatus Bathyarchaeia archaeon]